MDVLLAPLTLVFEVKAMKLYIPSLNCLQKMSQSFVLSDVLSRNRFIVYVGVCSNNLEHAQGWEWDSFRQRGGRDDLDSHLADSVDLP